MASYWQRRRARADARLGKAEQDVAKRAEAFYREELKRLEKEIAAFYAEFAEGQVDAYKAAFKKLSADDERMLWEDCDRFAAEYPERAWMVPVRKGIYRLTRLEGLQQSARLGLAKATAKTEGLLKGHFEQVAREAAKAVADTMGFDFYDDGAVRRFVGTKWADGKSFSERIWDNTAKLAEYVSGDMAKSLARGDSYAKLRDEIARRFVGQSVSNIMRVVQTEGTYVSRQVQGEEMRRAGFDAYYIDSVEDKHTCDTCRAISKRSHEEPFRFEDAKPGENYPPLHPRCRCDVNPAVDDWADFIKGGNGRPQDRSKVAERFGMSARGGHKWPAHGRMIRRDQFKELRRIAEEGDIDLVGFRKTDADFELCKKVIRAGVEAKRKLGIKTRLTFEMTAMADDDYAGTDYDSFNRIKLNEAAFRDAEALRRNLSAEIARGGFAAMDIPEGIIYHELGHTFALERGLDPMQAARTAFPGMSDDDIICMVGKDISEYAALYRSGLEFPSEVIAMLLSGKSNPTAYALAKAMGVPDGLLREI